MTYEYKYILKGETFAWTNARSGVVDIGSLKFPDRLLHEKIEITVNKGIAEEYVAKALEEAARTGASVDPHQLFREADGQLRRVLAVRPYKEPNQP